MAKQKEYSSLVSAPVSCEIGGRTYILSPFTLGDFKELEHYLQQDAIDSVKASLEGMPFELAKHLLDRAHAEQLKRRIGTQEFNAACQSLGGSIYMLWLSIRKRQAEVTKEQCETMLTPENIGGVMAKVNEMAGFKKGDSEDPFTKAK